MPGERTTEDIQKQGRAFLQSSGYEYYEVSAYAKPGFKCLHNVNYWAFGDYLGIGAGAHSKVTRVKRGAQSERDLEITRLEKYKQPARYMMADNKQVGYIASKKTVTGDELVFEFMLNVLRLQQAIPFELFCARTGLERSQLEVPLETAKTQGLVDCGDGIIMPTDLGRRFLNDLQSLFLPR